MFKAGDRVYQPELEAYGTVKCYDTGTAMYKVMRDQPLHYEMYWSNVVAQPKLEVVEGDLHLNGNIIVHRYEEGDADTINWPFLEDGKTMLAKTLYGAYECGEIPCRIVLLPDGEAFCIDDYVA